MLLIKYEDKYVLCNISASKYKNPEIVHTIIGDEDWVLGDCDEDWVKTDCMYTAICMALGDRGYFTKPNRVLGGYVTSNGFSDAEREEFSKLFHEVCYGDEDED